MILYTCTYARITIEDRVRRWPTYLADCKKRAAALLYAPSKERVRSFPRWLGSRGRWHREKKISRKKKPWEGYAQLRGSNCFFPALPIIPPAFIYIPKFFSPPAGSKSKDTACSSVCASHGLFFSPVGNENGPNKNR